VWVIIAQESREDAQSSFEALARLSQIAEVLQHTSQIVDADRHFLMVRANGRFGYSQRAFECLLRFRILSATKKVQAYLSNSMTLPASIR
jgi:hypothetical protein